MKRLNMMLWLLLASLPLAAENAAETAPVDRLPGIQQRWAEIKYAAAAPRQAKAFAELVTEIGEARKAQPEDLRLLLWEGIVLASQAGAQGGLGALGLCKRARADFEQVIAADGRLLDGAAYTSLGSLYYQVPGWPIGFGDDDRARELLQQGLVIDPDGIDANYFYGDYLLQQDQPAAAVAALEKALQAAPRPGRESADAGRRGEIERALQQARTQLD